MFSCILRYNYFYHFRHFDLANVVVSFQTVTETCILNFKGSKMF